MGTEVSLGDRERAVLRFAASQRVVLPRQVARMLEEETSAVDELLTDLTGAGVLVRDRVGSERPDRFRITRAGLQAIGSRSAPPRFEATDRRAVGVAWLWLAGRGGTFGRADRVLSEREMRDEDADGGTGSPFFVEPHEFGGGFERHYPDLVLVRGSDRIAIEVLLAAPPSRQVEAVLRAYAADSRIAWVLFMPVDPRLGHMVQAIAASLELSPFVGVQMLRAWS